MNSYTTSFTVDRSPAETFEAINNPRGWWAANIEGVTNQAGEEFTHEVKDVHYAKMRITELVPGELVVWRVVDGRVSFVADPDEWTGTEMRFELTENIGRTEVRFTHQGLIPDHECYDACSNAWGLYVAGSLRNLITTGAGNPNSNPDETRYQEQTQTTT